MENNYKHEEKICPCCGKRFECKVGDIANCQCQGIKFTEEDATFISKTYDDCLCKECLTKLNNADKMETEMN